MRLKEQKLAHAFNVSYLGEIGDPNLSWRSNIKLSVKKCSSPERGPLGIGSSYLRNTTKSSLVGFKESHVQVHR